MGPSARAHLPMPAAPRTKPRSVWPEQWSLVSWPRTPNVGALKAPRPHGLRLAGSHGKVRRRNLSLRPTLPPLGLVNSDCYADSFTESSHPLYALETLLHQSRKQRRQT